MVDFLGGKEEMKIQQKVNSVIFLLDVSNSMNAQDVQPSRLEQAKNILLLSFTLMLIYPRTQGIREFSPHFF